LADRENLRLVPANAIQFDGFSADASNRVPIRLSARTAMAAVADFLLKSCLAFVASMNPI